MKQTAVEFAINKLENLIPSGNQILIRAILIEAKEMEKQQQDELDIGFAEWCCAKTLGTDNFKLNDGELEIYKKEKGL